MEKEKKKEKWITRIDCRGDRELLLKVIEICRGIKRRDPTFKFSYNNRYVYIVSEDENIAHKRGMWFHHKVDSRLLYRVYSVRRAVC